MTRTIKLQHTEIAGCIFIDKIAGLNTHTPDHGKRGLVEIYSEELDRKLYVVHRLDKGTSGAIVFATSTEVATELTKLFEQHLVQKRYLFITDKKSSKNEFTYESFIEKEKNQFVSSQDKPANSKTAFKKLKSLKNYDLWEATPFSGKPHQIRLHAEANGIAILGDKDHNGSPFFRLCLHSLSLDFELKSQKVSFRTQDPAWAVEDNLELPVEDLMLLEAVQRRERMWDMKTLSQESLRLSHREIDSYRIDQYGDTLWVYWYKDIDPNEADLERFARLGKKLNKKIFVRKMLNRGDNPNEEVLWKIGDTQEKWSAKENGVNYELRSDTGLSPGLFLDQRENRLWIKAHAEDKRVLNLFSYTSGFSVVSALGGAQEVCTVDVSQNFIEWSKKNFQLNNLDPENYEFFVSDCLVFLKGTVRRKRKFNLIICDPPSFGRSKNGVFSISKNFEELILNCLMCLEKNGLLLFCTNYEKWETSDIHLKLNKLKSQFSFKILDAPSQGLDFELPDEEPLMKSIVIRKN
ncbi:Ribosomal RNA large subunit methyltransferase K [compost metagenome]